MRSSTVVLLTLVFSAPLLAQDSANARQYPPKPATRGVGVHVQYDPQYDKSVLQLDPTPLDATLRLSALAALDGRPVRKEADGVVLTFWSTAPAKRFQDKRTVSLSLDGAAAVSLGSASLVANPRPGYTEILMKSVSLDQWLAISKAGSVRLWVADVAYDFSPQLIASIRDFASQMAPQK
jgi:hypothetical protein